MSIDTNSYREIIVESYAPASTSGLHGPVHIRPLPGQSNYTQDMHVECSKDLTDIAVYPLGSKFRIKAKITNRKGGKPFVYSHYSWPFTFLE